MPFKWQTVEIPNSEDEKEGVFWGFLLVRKSHMKLRGTRIAELKKKPYKSL